MGTVVDLYFSGDEVFRAMADEIEKAQRFVHLEIYMFLSDGVGRAIAVWGFLSGGRSGGGESADSTVSS